MGLGYLAGDRPRGHMAHLEGKDSADETGGVGRRRVDPGGSCWKEMTMGTFGEALFLDVEGDEYT